MAEVVNLSAYRKSLAERREEEIRIAVNDLNSHMLLRELIRKVPANDTGAMNVAKHALIRTVLSAVAKHGLSDPHYFHISFLVRFPGVVLPANYRLPDEEIDSTIAIQHQWKDLSVDRESFSVTLWFKGRPGRVKIPFKAITYFADPAINFSIDFPQRTA